MLKKQGRLVGINTNGHYLDKKIDSLLGAGLDSLNVSLYPENYQKILDVLPAVTPLVHTKICKVIMRKMLDDPFEIEAAAELAQVVGASGLYLANVFPTKNAPTKQDENIIYDVDQLLYESIKLRIQRKFPNLSIHWPAAASKISPPLKKCRMPWFFTTVDALGNMGLCCNSSSCTKGNIFELAPTEVMNSAELVEIRERILNDLKVADICSNCYLMNDRYGSDM